MVRELTTEVQTVTIGRVRSIHPTPTTVSTSTSTAVALTLRTTTTVTTGSAFVRFWRIYHEIPEETRQMENKISDSSQLLPLIFFIKKYHHIQFHCPIINILITVPIIIPIVSNAMSHQHQWL